MVGIIVLVYLAVGMLMGTAVTFIVRRYDHKLELDDMTRIMFKDSFFTILIFTLAGVPMWIAVTIQGMTQRRRISHVAIRVRDRELIVLAEREKQGRLMVETIDLHHESLGFLNDLAQEEFIEWVELIRIELNRTGSFNREVLLWHLVSME